MPKTLSRMRLEILDIPTAIDRLLTKGSASISAAVDHLRSHEPVFTMTIGRGSSDHACTFLRYAIESDIGLPVASMGPSIVSVYRKSLRLDRALCLAVSQSGKSPDLVETTRSARTNGALTLALTNECRSPLASAADLALDIHAGLETSVAATKTFVNSVVTGLMLLAEWNQDCDLHQALHKLPEAIEAATTIDWPEVRQALKAGSSLFTLGRGPTLAISDEAALKFKETCQLHAESYSSAEVLHGPVSIIGKGFPVLCFAVRDAAEQSLAELSDLMVEKGAQAFATTDRVTSAVQIKHQPTGHRLTEPISLIVSFYAMVERLASEWGLDPDSPKHLKKVTETV